MIIFTLTLNEKYDPRLRLLTFNEDILSIIEDLYTTVQSFHKSGTKLDKILIKVILFEYI